MKNPLPTQTVHGCLAEIAKAVGHEHRLQLLELLAQGGRNVETLAARCGLTMANASQHLQQLRRAGLVSSRRDGKHVLYRLSDPAGTVGLLSALWRVAERNLAEMAQLQAAYFAARDSLEPVTRAELLDRLREGGTILLDVRQEEEFALGHLPGAINIPVDELEHRLAELPPAQEVVAYCRGPYCALAFEAVSALRSRGYSIRRLEGGFPEWLAAGLPVETAA
ncbi:MAG TPA: metalloregulator ArsR/SmtB family transcription factor [Alphaproteobacteria bacterium]|nr:metalloregulator ArsR/SmtB family transcription factor [Alphaproteobacteria bacterium]